MLVTLLLTSIWACSVDTSTQGGHVDGKYLAQVVDTLSSDYFLGRKPFTLGEERTLAYLQNELKALKLSPGNGSSFFQEVPLVEVTGQSEKNMHFRSATKNIDLRLKDEFVSYTQRIEEQIKVVDSEVIFCGFGITAPEYEWDDFEGIDVQGKTIIVLVNDPGFGSEDDKLFKGNTMTYYGRWTYKYEEAARQGAAAVLIIHETTSAGYPWFVVSSSWSGSKLDLRSEGGNQDKAAVQGWITIDAAQKLFEGAGHDLSKAIRSARTKDFKPFSLGYSMSHQIENAFEFDQSQNVVGMIKGASKPEECIIFSAHWDHLGVGQVVEGDSIYNGAVDNGTGVAAVLSIAKEMANAPPPARSVIFLLVTAEEQGLLGSQYYAENPIYPPAQTVANLNMDGMNVFGPMKYLTLTGMGHSELDEYAVAAAEAQGRSVRPNSEPEKGYFFRSDHFNFAKIGIPALYAEGDIEHAEKGVDYIKEQKDDYIANRYHRPADEYDAQSWDMRGLQEDADFYLHICQRLANESTWPQWKEGSEFETARNN